MASAGVALRCSVEVDRVGQPARGHWKVLRLAGGLFERVRVRLVARGMREGGR
jgi:hypothetical protein